MSLLSDIDPAAVETTSLPEVQMVTFDLYRDVHKGIRADLFTITSAAGYIDPSNRDARVGLAGEVSRVVSFLDDHAAHEDQHIEPEVERLLPVVARRIAADHRSFERTGELLVELAMHAVDATAIAQRGCVHRLYLELASFTSTYLAHQDLEERIVMPALERALGVEGDLAIHGAILASIPPEKMMASMQIMLPAMNVDDRTELLGGMAASAPPPAFAAVWSLAQQIVPKPDVATLATRLGLALDAA
jgi:hypothetical protein